MYESHFGFQRALFQACDGREDFFTSSTVTMVLPQLLHALRSDLGIAVLTGPPGCGKTTLLRHLRQQLLMDGRAVICSAAGLQTVCELHATIGHAASQAAGTLADPDSERTPDTWSRRQAVYRLQRSRPLWGPVILLIDDAHLLTVPVLNELRACLEECSANDRLIRCLLAGPLSLEDELARSSHADISTCIRCHVFLQTLTMQESVGYLQQHLQRAGTELSAVISASALEELVSAAAGAPRCLNLLTDECLLIAADKAKVQVDSECVNLALRRLQHLPYEWNISVAVSESDHGEPAELESDGMESERPADCEQLSPGVIEFGSFPEMPPHIPDDAHDDDISHEDDCPDDGVRSHEDVRADEVDEEFQQAQQDQYACFDRYTWISLQRDVPAGPDRDMRSLLYSSEAEELIVDELTAGEADLRACGSRCRSGLAEIALLESTDQEITTAMLTCSQTFAGRAFYLHRTVSLLPVTDDEDRATIPIRRRGTQQYVPSAEELFGGDLTVQEMAGVGTIDRPAESGGRRFDDLFTRLHRLRQSREL